MSITINSRFGQPGPEVRFNPGDVRQQVGGRPTLYSDEIKERICELVADGKSLRDICKDKTLPSRRTVQTWLEKNEEFRRAYEVALFCFAEDTAREVLEIIDDSSKDYVDTSKDGEIPVLRFDQEAVARSKARCAERKWYLGKLLPHRWGENGGGMIQAIQGPASAKEKDLGETFKRKPIDITQDPGYGAIMAYDRVLAEYK
jgi:hypothetical protein